MLGKALGVLGAGVFVVAFIIELTDAFDRKRLGRKKRKPLRVRTEEAARRPGPESAKRGDAAGNDSAV